MILQAIPGEESEHESSSRDDDDPLLTPGGWGGYGPTRHEPISSPSHGLDADHAETSPHRLDPPQTRR